MKFLNPINILKLIRKTLANRIFISGILILLQFFIMLQFLRNVAYFSWLSYLSFYLISIFMVLYLVVKTDNPAYKISWIIFIFTFPLLGGILYLSWGNTPLNISRFMKSKHIHIERELFSLSKLKIEPSNLAKIDSQYPKLASYVENSGNFPLYKNSGCEYFKSGELFFDSLVENLKNAKNFIFLEYFIIEEGHMWDTILEVLEEKAEKGVEIRLMYDDAGCLGTLPPRYHIKMQKKGIKCVRFNPFHPSLSTHLNHRDHRKICIIDGEFGYMGGANLADEYINITHPFGHWRDTAIVYSGESVTNLTIMFLELWDFGSNTEEFEFSKYFSSKKEQTQGFIQPFSDSPLDNYNIGENVYMHIINSAKKYVYITTPYLILDNELQTALCFAAQSGIDVRIVTPHTPDKKSVFAVTRSFYSPLIEAGVKIYEYTPGFIHCKMIISDDNIGVIGTINLDFRSFYMHFECGTILYNCPVLNDIYMDFNEILNISHQVKIHHKPKGFKKLQNAILRIFAPLM